MWYMYKYKLNFVVDEKPLTKLKEFLIIYLLYDVYLCVYVAA